MCMLSSGPRSGIGEIFIPDNEPGSSIMPGKVNPTQCEALTMMIAAQVIGNDVAIQYRWKPWSFWTECFQTCDDLQFPAQPGWLVMAVFLSMIKCAVGIEPIQENIKKHLDNSLMLVTALSQYKDRLLQSCWNSAESTQSRNYTKKKWRVKLGYVTLKSLMPGWYLRIWLEKYKNGFSWLNDHTNNTPGEFCSCDFYFTSIFSVINVMSTIV